MAQPILTRPKTQQLAASLAAVVAFAVVGMSLSAARASADEPYKVESFTAATTDGSGTAYTQAGGHLSRNDVEIAFPNPVGEAGGVKDAAVTLLPGFFGNPAAAPRCPSENVLTTDPLQNDCPPGSIVGIARTHLTNTPDSSGALGEWALYNVVPESGFPAQFAFRVLTGGHFKYLLNATLLPRTESYRLSVGAENVAQGGPSQLAGFGSTFFGVPSQHGSGTTEAPFLSNPVDCSEAAPAWDLVYDSWYQTGAHLPSGLPDFSDPNWKFASEPAAPTTGCADPALADQFNLTAITTNPLQPGGGPVQADQPTGLAVDLHFPQSNDPTDLETEFDPSIPQAPEPKDITVNLPAGLSISPSSASGLVGCSDLASDPAGDQVRYDDTKPVSCPDASKIGSATALSPTLASRDPVTDEVTGAEPIPGTVYLLKPHPGDLPVGGGSQGGKFRLLIELENPGAGINLKLPGVATADPSTGQLATVFAGNPQLPSSDIQVNLREGPRAPLASPTSCGSFQSTSDLVPWSTPDTPDAHPTASFDVQSGPNGSACPSSASSRPFAPTMRAGTDSPAAGKSSPFVLRIDRSDGEQELGKLDLTLPDGLSAKLAGIPACPEAALATAATRTGAAEQADPTCPASRLGTVRVGAGPGSEPFFASGGAYLAGPYKGAPLSVAVITPAVAGPFDLGAIVNRNALFLDPATAQAHVVSDPLPQTLDGIPLRLRTIIVDLDRPDFTLNPTDCAATAVNATITSTDGTASSPAQFFQAGECGALGFKPTLKLALKGSVSRRAHPSLKATLTARPGDANIASAQVKLPKAAFLDNAHIGTPCTRPQFTAKQCPASSVVGYASATTPLLGYELTGSVYLRSNPAHKLPDLVVGFNGPASQPIEIELAGKTDSVKGALRNTFEAVPDVPVTKFSLTLFGGKKGLIEMSSGFCSSPKASIRFTGQNGIEAKSTPTVAAKCPKGKKGKKKGKRGSGHKHR